MLRLFEFFGGKNSSPIFSTLVRARASSPCILLVGTIKAFNFYYLHFLLRPFLSEIFAGPFHREKMIEQGKTVISGQIKDFVTYLAPTICFPKPSLNIILSEGVTEHGVLLL